MNITKNADAVKNAGEMGYSESSVLYLGLIGLLFTGLYLIPKTTVLGAALLTAWLGGAVATHVIKGDPIGQMLPAVVFGIVVWLAIWLRNGKLRDVFPVMS